MNNKETLSSEAFFKRVFLEGAAKELADSTPPSALDPPEQHYKRSLQQVERSFAMWKEELTHAGQLLDEAGFKCANLENPKPRPNGFPESIKTCYDLLIATPQDFLELTPEEFQRIYSIACDHFERKDFIGARDLFLLMVTLNPRVSPPWLGLGLAEQRQGRHEEALVAFSQAIDLDPENPGLYLHIARSLRLSDHPSEAVELLNGLINLCENYPEWADIKGSATTLKQKCEEGSR